MGHLGTTLWTSALPQNGEALPLTCGHGPVFLIPKSTGASSLVRAAVEPPAGGGGVEDVGGGGWEQRAEQPRKGFLSCCWVPMGFLGMRTAWCETSPEGKWAVQSGGFGVRC